MNKTIVFITTLTVVTAICVALMCAQAGTNLAPTVDFIAAALQEQSVLSGKSLEVKYKYWQAGYDLDKLDLRYIRTPEALYIERNSKGTISTNSYDRLLSIYRELHITVEGTKTGYVGNKLGGMLGAQLPMDTTFRPLDSGYIVDVIRRGTVSESRSQVDGYECWAVTASAMEADSDVSSYTIWVDPDVGFSPRKVEFQFKDKARPIKTIDFKDYKEISQGVWFPMEIRIRTHVADNGRLPQQLIGDLEFISRADQVNIDKAFTKAELTVEFPSGTDVRDEVLDATYTVP